jgi:pilus assembly protein Flp/PilA
MPASHGFVAYDYTMPEQRSCAFVSTNKLVSEYLVCGKCLHLNVNYSQRREKMKKFILDFIREEEGLTTVEYAVAGALVAVAVVTAFTQLGEQVGLTIDTIKGAITPKAA